jgi:predicted DNA-binding transcriptional regulator AlpA
MRKVSVPERSSFARCPPYQDIATLCANLCLCESTVETWIKRGELPPPIQRGGKRLWKWSEVEKYLDRPASSVPDAEAERIRNDTRAAVAERETR